MLYLLQVNVLVGIAILLPLFALYLVLMVLRLGYLAARLSLTTHANLRLQRGGVCGPPTRGLYCASDAALRWRCDPIGRRTNPVAAMIRSTEEKSEMLQCKRKVRRNSAPLDKYALQAAQPCRVPLLSMTSNNTWDYFDASSDKNRVVWYWVASVVQRTSTSGPTSGRNSA
jgi:hypothetical protein